jgi:hypothetical protein
MTDREAFEKWYLDGGTQPELTRSIRYPDQYNDQVVDAMWDGWQAATAAERERCAKVCEEQADGNGGVSAGPMATERGKLVFESMAVGAMNCAAAIRGTK